MVVYANGSQSMMIRFYRSPKGVSINLSCLILNSASLIGLYTTSELTGYFVRRLLGLMGRFSNPPPQFGHTFLKIWSTQSLQKVHSNVQIIASEES